jgi:hypothetical protein
LPDKRFSHFEIIFIASIAILAINTKFLQRSNDNRKTFFIILLATFLPSISIAGTVGTGPNP